MATIDRAVKQLQSEQKRLRRELERVDAALSALTHLSGRGRGRGRSVASRAGRRQRHMSASARRRIAAAQKARWAKLREQRLKKAA